MSLDRKVIKRIAYTFLDWLGDVGGLNGALGGSFLIILAVLQYRAINQLLVPQLFTIGKRDQSVK